MKFAANWFDSQILSFKAHLLFCERFPIKGGSIVGGSLLNVAPINCGVLRWHLFKCHF